MAFYSLRWDWEHCGVPAYPVSDVQGRSSQGPYGSVTVLCSLCTRGRYHNPYLFPEV